jgi:hypothetical protein
MTTITINKGQGIGNREVGSLGDPPARAKWRITLYLLIYTTMLAAVVTKQNRNVSLKNTPAESSAALTLGSSVKIATARLVMRGINPSPTHPLHSESVSFHGGN